MYARASRKMSNLIAKRLIIIVVIRRLPNAFLNQVSKHESEQQCGMSKYLGVGCICHSGRLVFAASRSAVLLQQRYDPSRMPLSAKLPCNSFFFFPYELAWMFDCDLWKVKRKMYLRYVCWPTPMITWNSCRRAEVNPPYSKLNYRCPINKNPRICITCSKILFRNLQLIALSIR